MRQDPVKVIMDTDMGGGGCQDCDDVGMLCMANAMADKQEIELLAIVLSTQPDASAAMIGVLQYHYGRHVPVGAYKGKRRHPLTRVHDYVPRVAKDHPSNITTTAQLPSSVDVYRRVLAAQPDGSVVITCVGMLTNLAALLQSGPDAHSTLTGKQLLASKVKLLAIMGGRFPSGDECNWNECNLWEGCSASGTTRDAVNNLPKSLRVVYIGQEIGYEILHGAALSTCTLANNPCRHAYVSYLDGTYRDRFSWDPLTLLIAVRGIAAVPGIDECIRPDMTCHGWPTVNARGSNGWEEDATSPQMYVQLSPKLNERAAATVAMDDLLCQTPAVRFRSHRPSGFERVARGPTVCFSEPAADHVPLPNAYWFQADGGLWGGTCTCPDGQQYPVSDNGDYCASLACSGGTSGKCTKKQGPWSHHSAHCGWKGHGVPVLTVYDASTDVVLQTFQPSTGGTTDFRWHGEVCTDSTLICFGIGELAEGCSTTDPQAWMDGSATFSLSNGVTLTLQAKISSSSPPQPPSLSLPPSPPPPRLPSPLPPSTPPFPRPPFPRPPLPSQPAAVFSHPVSIGMSTDLTVMGLLCIGLLAMLSSIVCVCIRKCRPASTVGSVALTAAGEFGTAVAWDASTKAADSNEDDSDSTSGPKLTVRSHARRVLARSSRRRPYLRAQALPTEEQEGTEAAGGIITRQSIKSKLGLNATRSTPSAMDGMEVIDEELSSVDISEASSPMATSMPLQTSADISEILSPVAASMPLEMSGVEEVSEELSSAARMSGLETNMPGATSDAANERWSRREPLSSRAGPDMSMVMLD